MLSSLKKRINRIFLIIFLIFWVYNWTVSLRRDFSNHFEETKKLCGKSLEEKWKYIFGDDLYQLLAISKNLISVNEKVSFVHNLDVPKWSLACYSLYPREMVQDGKFIIVYKQPFNKNKTDKIIYSQDSDIFIIQK